MMRDQIEDPVQRCGLRHYDLIGARKSPVQSVSMDLATNKANFSFGPPQHLRPSEFLELFNPLE